ncbi:MAG: class I adenylate-forming enzyme family protein [Eubacteriales bacterium]
MKNTIIECINHYATATPDKLAIIDETIELSYEQYWNKIVIVASFLKNVGAKEGDYIVVKNTQTVPFMVAVHAVQLINAIVVPIEKSANEGRVHSLVGETNAKILLGDIVIDECDCYTIEEVYGYSGVIYEFTFPRAEDISMVLFTTGTTGKSKGVVISHRAERAVGENLMLSVEMKENNVELLPMPMNHAYSLRRYFANMVNGCTAIILDGVFFVQRVFAMMDKYQATSIAMAPAALNIIFQLSKDKLGEYAEQLDYLQFGTAPISEADKNRLIELLPNVRLYNVYASTEMGCVCVLNFNSEDNKPSCLGYASRGTSFKMVDENGNELSETTVDAPGLITYTGDMLMEGYYKEPELTSKTIVNGYIQTSDLGYQDTEGRVYMLGRADDVISTGGNKVSPLEVEDIAKQYSGIIDCICKGKADKRLGAVPVLYIVADEEIDTKKLSEHMANQLEDFKRPRSIKKIDEVPRTYNGKVDRKTEI